MSKYISKIPKPLLDQFIQGAVVPFVGSGFSKNADMPQGITMPDWTELGARAAKELPEYEYRNDPLDAISCYEEIYSRSSLIKFLKRELHIDSGLVKPNDTYKAFCEVFQDTVLTTNFDSLLETGYRNSGYQCDPVITSKQLPVLEKIRFIL